MLPVGSFVSNVAGSVGFMAASIAVGGFLLQAVPTLNRRKDQDVRAAAVIGGLAGFIIAVAIIIFGSW
ncbi:MAG TPA: hypothetical protein VG448_13740 [Solirubrobacterales bacterium]|nr:hypothetical protein [Solirubrobacterales bacterium]